MMAHHSGATGHWCSAMSTENQRKQVWSGERQENMRSMYEDSVVVALVGVGVAGERGRDGGCLP